MTRDEVFEKIREILSERFELDKDEITPEATLFEDLALDSIDAVDLIVELKPYIKGNIDPSMFKKARTVRDLTGVIFELVEKR